MLAPAEVRHVGDGVAFVVADTLEQAKDAAEAIALTWETLPHVVGAVKALEPGAPQVWPDRAGNLAFEMHMGDRSATEQAFASAARTAEIALVNQRLVTNYLDTRGVVAEYDAANDRVTLTLGSQGSHSIRDTLCQMLKLAPEKVRVVTPDVGGGFGTKLFFYREYALATLAAMRLKRPVRWVAERMDHFLGDTHGRDNITTARLALDDKGKFLALDIDLIADMGAYLSEYAPYIPYLGIGMSPGVYDIPACHVRLRAAYTNTVPVDAYRGAGRPEASYVIERLVDAAARELDVAPDALRRRNFIKPKAMPYETATGKTYDSGDFAMHLARAQEIADWAGFKKRAAAAKRQGLLRGIGHRDLHRGLRQQRAGNRQRQARARRQRQHPDRLAVDRAGARHVLCATRGRATGLAARTRPHRPGRHRCHRHRRRHRRIELDPVRRRVARGRGDQARRQSEDACRRRAGSQCRAIWRSPMARCGFPEPIARSRSRSWRSARTTKPDQLKTSDAFTPPAPTYPNGTHVVEVEVDPATGATRIVNYVVVDDFGVTLNPLLLAGQVHGGAVQGIGQALMEQTVYDEASGQLVTASLMDYALPRAGEMPSFQFETSNVPCRVNPLGVKGAGEAGAIGSCPAVMNAIVDALWRPYSVGHLDMPATPERVWTAIEEGKRQLRM